MRSTTTSLFVFCSCLLAIIVVSACKQSSTSPTPVDASAITLQWHRAFDGETEDQIETGLKWTFLNLGAELPQGSFSKSSKWLDGNKIQINFSGLGFSDSAMQAITSLNTYLKNSQEYKINKAFDIGKYVMLTMNSSYHYYSITGAPDNLLEYRRQFAFDQKFAAILESTVAVGGRLIELPDASDADPLHASFIAHTGSGDIGKNAFVIGEYETIQLMHNGQFRFAIYDTSGKLVPSSNTAYSTAGKPSKCMWCHEINLQPTHAATTNASSTYYTFTEFNNLVGKWAASTSSYRSAMHQDVDFTRIRDHSFSELLYITFMEPSAQRLASEWKMSITDVKTRLSRFATHRNTEHAGLGEAYNRADIDFLSPFPTLKFPSSAREYSAFEPQYIQ